MKNGPEDKPKPMLTRGSSLWRLVRSFLVPPRLCLTLIAAVAALTCWKGEPTWRFIANVAYRLGKGTWDLFAWGLVFLVLAILALLWVLAQGKIGSALRRWNYWLASISFTLAAWGTLAYLRMGGSFGQGIIIQANLVGVLRIVALAIIGTFLIVPKSFFGKLKTKQVVSKQ